MAVIFATIQIWARSEKILSISLSGTECSRHLIFWRFRACKAERESEASVPPRKLRRQLYPAANAGAFRRFPSLF